VADEPRVHKLLLERVQAKKLHKFERADELRALLQSECNVEVFDKTKFWRVAGGRGHVPLPSGEAKPRSKPPPRPAAGSATASASEPLPSRKGAKALRKQEQAAAEAKAQTPIASGFGHAMLLKMGWGGQGSGLKEGALAEPFKITTQDAEKSVKAGKRGLAAEPEESKTVAAASGAKRQKKTKEMWLKDRAAADEATAEMPTLVKMRACFQEQLGVDGETLTQVVDNAAKEAGVSVGPAATLKDKARAVWIQLGRPALDDAGAEAADGAAPMATDGHAKKRSCESGPPPSQPSPKPRPPPIRRSRRCACSSRPTARAPPSRCTRCCLRRALPSSRSPL
jgi:hypothetical protein